MKRAVFIGMAAAALALGACERDQHGNVEPSGREAREGASRVGQAAEQVGRGTVNAVRSAGHGVAYGARELGQSLSGTQGNPQAEARAAEERRAMEARAQRAGAHMERAGESVEGDRAPSSRGGGPEGFEERHHRARSIDAGAR